MAKYETHFAPIERATAKKLVKQVKTVAQAETALHVLNALPNLAIVVNENRQIVFANKTLLTLLSFTHFNLLNGYRLGEALNCENAFKEPGGCGTSENCKYCGAVNAIVACLRNKKEIRKECRITVNTKGETKSLDLSITAAPFELNNEFFVLVTLDDISDLKRRQVLEKIFFHDIINLANGLKGIVDILKDEITEENALNYIEMADKVSSELFQEIVAQRTLVAAENNELSVQVDKLSVADIFKNVKTVLQQHPVALNKKINIAHVPDSLTIATDSTLLNRVLINLTKNALEASNKGQSVTLNANLVDGGIVFTVHNEWVMPVSVQLQIFQRSFSTKGKNRGIGTYSIKLLTERYLKGQVSFTSKESHGTIFTITVPNLTIN
ncbi:MAG: sensor histidine kinase [Chitinophagaceae bacterium]